MKRTSQFFLKGIGAAVREPRGARFRRALGIYQWPLMASRGERLERQNFLLAALDQAANAILPQRQCGAYLTPVGRLVVATTDLTAMTLMIEDLLDHVRGNAEVMQAGGKCPADVVQTPARYATATVEVFLAA